MSRFLKISAMSLLTILLGFLVNLTPIGSDLEEDIGLHLLFKLRGVKMPPEDVLVVSMDNMTVGDLSLLSEPEKWPRSLHAGLTQILAGAGAAVIAFDIFFEEARQEQQDKLFAKAIEEAGNVVLCQTLRKETVPLANSQGESKGSVNLEKLVSPNPQFARAAIALAPFPLPKIPIKVSQYWTFKSGAGGKPTLPIVAFQVFSLDVYDEFIQLLAKVRAQGHEDLPQSKEAVKSSGSVEQTVQAVREVFHRNPSLGRELRKELDRIDAASFGPKRIQILKQLISMYESPNSLYLNYYGPPGTITTLPYHRLLQSDESKAGNTLEGAIRGKAVFVGLSQLLRPEQRDGVYTVFSQSNGIDLSGVEVAATAFGNLLDDRPVDPLSPILHFALLVFWGMVLAAVCRLLPAFAAALAVVALGTLYLAAAEYQFKSSGTWYPLAIPLMFQMPVAFFGTLWWKYIDTQRERRNIRRAFGYYLPDRVVDELARGMGKVGTSSQMVHGTCMCTDGEQYVSLSEMMSPKELTLFMNRYYETVFKPVKEHGGIISDVVGDSMMAIWATSHPDAALRTQACLASVDIADAVKRFNRSSDNLKLPTRIGMHSGLMSLGSIGGVNHYEYRAVGDVVNTAARIEGLNKVLGTQILASYEVIEQLSGLLTRELGSFVLAGKSKPVEIHELLCRMEHSSEEQRKLCAVFAEALDAYRKQYLGEARALFQNCLEIAAEDGPSRFYMDLCKKNEESPSEEGWDGLIYMNKK